MNGIWRGPQTADFSEYDGVESRDSICMMRLMGSKHMRHTLRKDVLEFKISHIKISQAIPRNYYYVIMRRGCVGTDQNRGQVRYSVASPESAVWQ